MSKCGLCREDRQLVRSHLIPAAAYRQLRDEGTKNPNPVVFSPGHARSTSDQVQKPFLCSDCEQRFSDRGERLLMREIAREDQFKLRERLKKIQPMGADDLVQAYDLRRVYQDAAADFVYFPISVFWRASATSWRDRGKDYRLIRLGPYEERFRSFLLDQEPFPRDAVLIAQLAADEPFKIASVPASSTHTGYRKHQFYVPGILFTLLVGKVIPKPMQLLNMLQSNAVILFAGPLKQAGLFRHFARVIRELPSSHKLRKRRDETNA